MDADRRENLRAFLREARGRLDPASFGFSTIRRRLVPGLRREELADLLGVSETWYARFEGGRALFSLRLLTRLANVLGLDDDERVVLLRLARPESERFGFAAVRDTFSGETSRRFRAALRGLQKASDVRDAADAVSPYLASLRDDVAAGYWATRLQPARLRFDAAAGPRSEELAGTEHPQMQVRAVHRRLDAGATIRTMSLEASDSERLRAAARDFGVVSSLLVPLRPDGTGWSFVLGALFTKPIALDEREVAMVEALAALGEATFAQTRQP